nr:retrotransposon protein, putative, Ty1-copia subclass [Tanacetum cinerariifolium]
MFQAKASKERLDVVKSLMACKPKPEAFICAFVLEMKGYFARLESLNMVFGTELSINIIIFGLPADYNQKERLLIPTRKGKATQEKSDHGSKRKVESEIASTSDPKEAVFFYYNTKRHWKRSYQKYLKDLKDIKVKKGVHSEMTRNIISFHALFKDVYQFSFDNENGDILVFSNSCFMFKASPCKGIYETIECISNDGNMILNVGSSNELDKSKLWHSRLRHVNKKRIAQLQKDGVLESFDFKSDDVCEAIKDENRYYIMFTDDFSRYGYVYLVKHKSDTFEVFKRYQNKVENQLGRKIKVLRSDRRGEYLSIEFLDNLKNCGIVSQLTPPRTPQLNGVAERRNRTLLDMVRPMMCRATLPISFWGYPLETAAHILNLVPTMKVLKTPFEMWKGKRPSLGHIKI